MHGSENYAPYAQPAYLQGFKSPLIIEIFTGLKKDDTNPPASKAVYRKLAKVGLLAARIGPGKHLETFQIIGDIAPAEFDYFHEMILHEENRSNGLPGYSETIGSGLSIGLPPVMNFAKEPTKSKVMEQVLNGDKIICLAISEPGAGSDVAGILTTAVKTPDGKHYIVNGVKKWITNGTFADYFTTAVRTGPGKYDISVILIERNEQLSTRSIKTSHNSATGTAYVVFENCMVPAENLLGKEGDGFKIIMYNFNHERWVMVAGTLAETRSIISECFNYAVKKNSSGVATIGDPAVRFKLANMVSKLEAGHSWLENITYQMTLMDYQEQSLKLAGPIALLKMLSSRIAHDVSDYACQIFGVDALDQLGIGSKVEGFQRTYKFRAILGGSEEILAQLAIKQAMKAFPNARL
ncbi:hypothetical protein HK103_000920 [Boothiomyces macroporosus]|uniref:Acyl-CoA dehydrogenase n=1 Tax=Boothiomyces macroporosus TaxID=261099 RepID=A0AAD5UK27_9FUNG|nr:hypothetical protein HK103_000920 [Boothiomyces macroporosus]